MEIASKNKLKFIHKLSSNKERNKYGLFVSTDCAVIKRAKRSHLLEASYLINQKEIGIIKYLPSKELGKRIVYLDEISDPTNLGKIILLMKKYGLRDLILSPNSVSLYNEKCLDIAKDSIFDINIVYGDINLLKRLKKDHQIIGTGLKSTSYLQEAKIKDKYILVLGNESRGVSPTILSLADEVIKIKIDHIDSLNVAVAASIIFDNLN